jgi:hypothetical protein
MQTHLFLVVFLVLAVGTYLLLDFLAHILVILDFTLARILQLTNHKRDFGHSFLKVFSELSSFCPLFIKHSLMLQVQLVILLEDGATEEF